MKENIKNEVSRYFAECGNYAKLLVTNYLEKCASKACTHIAQSAVI